MDGQAAEAPGSEGIAGLADFLIEADKPQGTGKGKSAAPKADDSTGSDADTEDDLAEALSDDDTEDDDSDEAEQSAAKEGESEDDEEADPEADKQEAGRKIKVTVKGDDGQEQTLEVDEQELARSYLRQSDYTRKTQELAKAESQAVEVFQQRFQAMSSDYQQRIEQVRGAVVAMAGLKSQDEMARLAASDPAAWVAESQRQQAIGQLLSQMDEQSKAERTKAEQARETAMQTARRQLFEQSWAKLAEEKIDKAALTRIYGEVSKSYGFSPDELGNVLDHRIVLLMRDAAELRALKAKRGEVTKKTEAAPRLPSRQTSSLADKQRRELDQKFKSGRAKLRDLASYLM